MAAEVKQNAGERRTTETCLGVERQHREGAASLPVGFAPVAHGAH
jgi:hypothetical protein